MYVDMIAGIMTTKRAQLTILSPENLNWNHDYIWFFTVSAGVQTSCMLGKLHSLSDRSL